MRRGEESEREGDGKVTFNTLIAAAVRPPLRDLAAGLKWFERLGEEIAPPPSSAGLALALAGPAGSRAQLGRASWEGNLPKTCGGSPGARSSPRGTWPHALRHACCL